MDRSNNTTEKAKDMKKALLNLIHYCKNYIPVFVIALVATIVSTILQVVGPDKFKDFTNEIMAGLTAQGMNMNVIEKIAIMLALIYLISFLFNYLQSYIFATVTQKISQKMRTNIVEKMNRLPLKYFDSNSVGNTLSRITNDVDTIGQTLSQSVGSLLSAVIMFVGSIVMMIYNSPLLTLLALASTAIGLLGNMLLIKSSQKHFVEQQSELGKINGFIEENYTGHNVVKVYNGADKAKETFEESNGKLYNSAWKSQFISSIMVVIMNFVSNLGYVVVCVVGAALAMKGIISFGVIIAFTLYIKQFSQPLSQLAEVTATLQRTAAAGERVFEFLDEEEMEDETQKDTQLTNVKGKVEFDHVRFGYDSEKPIIKDFSEKISAGQKVAIVGPTGAGKTTLVNLLMRFYDLDSGEILIDNMPISEFSKEEIHKQFGMVLQDSWIFNGTIRENMIYNKENVTEEELVKAAKSVGMHHFISSLPDGYDTIMDDKVTISDGQKQLLTIARAIIQDAPLMILDEATSSVDTRTELLVQESMEKLTEGRTSFVIAHRLSTIKNADLILVMKEGDVIESGTHQELMEANGFYADLYNSQFVAA